MAILEAESGVVADRDRVGGVEGIIRVGDRGVVAQGDVPEVSTQVGVDRECGVISSRDGVVGTGSNSRDREIERVAGRDPRTNT